MNRAQRRAAERKKQREAKRAGRGLAEHGKRTMSVAHATAGIIIGEHGRTRHAIAALAQNTVGLVDDYLRQGSGASIACREGCAWCCYLHVDVTAPEVFVIAEYVRREFRSEEQEALRQRLVDLYERTKDLAPAQRQMTRRPCALLVDDRCSVYPVRPALCRGYNSADANQCDRFLDDPTLKIDCRVADVVFAGAVGKGNKQAMKEAGFDQPRDLSEGLLVALSDDDAADRWLRGEAIFAARRRQLCGLSQPT